MVNLELPESYFRSYSNSDGGMDDELRTSWKCNYFMCYGNADGEIDDELRTSWKYNYFRSYGNADDEVILEYFLMAGGNDNCSA